MFHTNPEKLSEILEVMSISNRESFGKVVPAKDFQDPIFSLKELEELFSKIDFFVYVEESKILGVAGLEVDENDIAWMRLVYVLPKYQGKGIGKELVQRIELEAQMKGLFQISLFTYEKATWAIEFYKKLGYEIIGKARNPWGHDIIMKKRFSL